MTMRYVLLVVLLWVLGGALARAECGGVLTEEHGVIQTPGFPRPFPVPLKCRWIVDSSDRPRPEQTAIVVYLTQLFVSSGLTFREFGYYEPDSPLQLDGLLLHSVTENNVVSVQWLWTKRNYFVIELELERLEGNHLRVLDDLLDVYGFNITYEMVEVEPGISPVRNDSCSVIGCSLAGNCYASADYLSYWCSCFDGFSGADCSQGPLCEPDTNICRNGGTCRHVGMSAICHCPASFTGSTCEAPIVETGCEGDEECSTQCRYDGSRENACNCDTAGMGVSPERSRFEMRIRLANVSTQRIKHPGRTLNHFLEKQILKFLRNIALSKVEDLQVLNISAAGEVVFHFFGSGHDAGRVREAGNHLLERGRLGEIQLVPTQHSFSQEPALSLESVRVRHKEQIIREGDQFSLSCIAQGSSYMNFQWYKDGAPINPSKSLRTMWTQILPLDSREQYTAILGIQDVNILDEGHYTCQVSDWGVQECKSVYIQIMQAPHVLISPMSATVQKGDNINLKCVSTNSKIDEQIGYSWTRDNALFPMVPGKEYWEDLKPGGTILRIYNIQKTTTYTCKAHTSVATEAQSVRIDVVNRSSIAICLAETSGGVSWVDTSPGSTAISDCPNRYIGTAKRLCLISEPGKAVWQRPDFSECLSYRVYNVIKNFRELVRGFEVTTLRGTLASLTAILQDRSILYPGEGEPVVLIINELFYYMNRTNDWECLLNMTNNFFKTVNLLLQFDSSIIHQEKVYTLQMDVDNWSLLWGLYLNTSVGHLAYDNLVADVVSFQDETPNSFYIPMLSTSYPSWFHSKIAIHVIGQNKTSVKNSTNRIAVVCYRNLTSYLQPLSSQKMIDGSEMTYEIISDIVSVSASGPLKDLNIKIEFPLRGIRNSWNVTCAVASSLETDWEFTSCNYSIKNLNVSQCVCRKLGVYATMLTSHSTFNSHSLDKNFHPSSIVVIGCACCLLQTLLTLIILLIQCLHHTTCILLLKIQCCTSVAISMTIFIYTSKHAVTQYSYSYVSTIIESLIFIGISTHLSKLLIVYTEVVHLPNIRNLKYTVFGIVTGVTIITLLCSLLAHHLSGNILSSWWLPYDSTLFYVATTCGILLLTLFTFLYCNLMHRLKLMLTVQNSKTSRAICRRMKFLKRTAMLFGSMIIMTICSILYVNIPNKLYQYLFSISCASLGLIMLLCYVLCSETSLQQLVFKNFKFRKGKNQDFNSDSDNNLFNFFTKQEPELESDSAPPCLKKPITIPLTDLVPELEHITFKQKMVTFNGSSPIKKKTEEKGDVDLEDYPNSPRKYVKITSENSSPQFQAEDQSYPSAIIHSTENTNFGPTRDLHLEYIQPGDDLIKTRVCVELGVVKNIDSSASAKETPIVTCSVDVEPGSNMELNELKVTGSDSCFVELKEKSCSDKKVPISDNSSSSKLSEICEDHDVLDRISHDLDYLLNRTSDDEGISYQRHRKHSASEITKPGSILKNNS